jgi:hypothetical protein
MLVRKRTLHDRIGIGGQTANAPIPDHPVPKPEQIGNGLGSAKRINDLVRRFELGIHAPIIPQDVDTASTKLMLGMAAFAALDVPHRVE